MSLELFELGEVPWWEAQWIYHALPRLGRPALVLCWPDRPHLCLGHSQDLEAEVDLEFCARRRLPVFRRAVGGGLVYLDSRQVFFQLVLPRGGWRPVAEVYRRCLEPVVAALSSLGLGATLRPPADVVVSGRKISGNGGGDLSGHPVVVGNVLLDFDYETMTAALRAPNPVFRELVARRMRRRLTTLSRELRRVPSRRVLARLLAASFEAALGPFRRGRVDEALRREMARVGSEMASPDWPDHDRRPAEGRDVKIAEGCYVRHRALPAVPLTATWVEEEGLLREVSFGGEVAEASPAVWARAGRVLEGVPARAEAVAGVLAGAVREVPGEWLVSLFCGRTAAASGWSLAAAVPARGDDGVREREGVPLGRDGAQVAVPC